VPRDAGVGDLLRLPVRVVNRTAQPRHLAVTVAAGAPPRVLAEERIRVPAGDAVQVPVTVRLGTPGEDRLLVAVLGADGAPLDVVRRPITVRPPARRAHLVAEALVSGAGTVVLEVPGTATAGGAELVVRGGTALFDAPASAAVAGWLEAWQGAPEARAPAVDGARPARTIGAVWRAASVGDDAVGAALKRLARVLGRESLRGRATALLELAPATRHVGARRKLAPDLAATLRALRAEVEAGVAQVGDDPYLFATAAAALAWTAPPQAELGRVRTLVERARRHEVRVGPFTWIAVPGGDDSDDAEASALLALAEIRLAAPDRAFALLQTLHERRAGLGGGPPLVARVAALMLAGGEPPAAVTLTVDGHAERAVLRGGLARLAVPALARPGRHEIRIASAGGSAAPIHVAARAEVGLPWSAPPGPRGSLDVTLEGQPGGRGPAALALVVRNRSPRVIGTPVLEVSVPAGAELEVPLPFRWSVAGTLHGLGVASFPQDRPEDLVLLAPRALEVVGEVLP
jgi:hypothetical protein